MSLRLAGRLAEGGLAGPFEATLLLMKSPVYPLRQLPLGSRQQLRCQCPTQQGLEKRELDHLHAEASSWLGAAEELQRLLWLWALHGLRLQGPTGLRGPHVHGRVLRRLGYKE